jgi:AraC-like DNA-binding protein
MTEDDVASRFRIDRRTVHRRLQANGTCFRELTALARFDLARRALSDTGLGTGELAETPGFADASSFTRAFRRCDLFPAWRI